MTEMDPADVPEEFVTAAAVAFTKLAEAGRAGDFLAYTRAVIAAVLPLHSTPLMQFRICQSPHGVLQDWTDITDGYSEFFGDMTSAGRIRVQFRQAPGVGG